MFKRLDRMSDAKAISIAIAIAIPGAVLIASGNEHPARIFWGMMYLGVILISRLTHFFRQEWEENFNSQA
jgi:hypothetical protein